MAKKKRHGYIVLEFAFVAGCNLDAIKKRFMDALASSTAFVLLDTVKVDVTAVKFVNAGYEAVSK